MLPAPKNSGRPAATSSPQQAPAQADRPLIPHSLANKRRAKAKPSGQHGTTQPSAATGADRPARATDAGSGSEDVQTDPTGGAPFFTIGEAAASEIERPGETAGVADAEETGAPDINDTHTNMVYDPTSGYYYDTGSGAYYFYDTERGEFVDARAHYSGSMQDSDEPAAPTVGSADLEKLLRRGELGAAAGAAIATVSQAAQLAAGGYSDARAAADYSARRTAEQQRQTTRRRIDGDEIGKQKKHKHNIMYLALQAQEQEASLNEAHARHKATKKAARARYGL
ncbi:hypothetical protein IWQ56_003472 [Coemansia nantahalensis]|nr:hypothetical protein IWQ56_003472 [Coemansia nantahalensis]